MVFLRGGFLFLLVFLFIANGFAKEKIVKLNINDFYQSSEITTKSKKKKSLSLTLPDGRKIFLERDFLEKRKSGFSWFGKVKGYPDSDVIITVEEGVLTGRIKLEDKIYEIKPFSLEKGLYTVEDKEGKEVLPFGEDFIPPEHIQEEPIIQPTSVNYEDGSRVDALFLYTQEMEDKYGSSLKSTLQRLADIANRAFRNSRINTKLNVVGIVKYDTSDTNENVDISTSLKNISDSQEVENLREKYKADVVTLFRVYGGSRYCGLAWIPMYLPEDIQSNLSYLSSAYKRSAFSVVNVGSSGRYYCSDLTYAHEVGHNFGCQHDRDHAQSEGAYPYSYGYDIPGTFATIMSYDTPEIEYFSNPDIYYQGYQIGKPETDPEAANNAKTINKTRLMVANYIVANNQSAVSDKKAIISVYPVFVDFGNVKVNEESLKSVYVSNTGEAPLSITSISLKGGEEFRFTENCIGKNLNRGESCNINIYFSPTSEGIKNGTLIIENNSSNNPRYQLGINGRGVSPQPPAIVLNKRYINFGEVYLRKTKKETIRIENVSIDSNLEISVDYSSSKEFTIVNRCSSTVYPQSSCSLDIIFSPLTQGEKDYRFRLTTNDPDNRYVYIYASGIGIPNPPQLKFHPESINFGEVFIGEESSKSLYLENIGDEDLRVKRLVLDNNSKDFSLENKCSVIKGQEQCEVVVTFKPSKKGKITGNLILETGQKRYTIPLEGYGKEKLKPVIDIDKTHIDAGVILLGEEKTLMLNISNKGKAPLKIEDIKINSPDIHILQNCSTLNPDTSCSIKLKITGKKKGIYRETIEILSNDPQKELISITVEYIVKGIAKIQKLPEKINFGELFIGDRKKETLSIKNIGSDILDIKNISLKEEKNFKLDTGCKKVAPEKKCNIDIIFSPTSEGIFTDVLQIETNIGIFKVSLKGKGKEKRYILGFNKNRIDFGNVYVGDVSYQKLFLENQGNVGIKIENISIEGKNVFSIDGNCDYLDVGEKCVLNISFNPDKTGSFTGNISIKTSFSIYKIPIQGKGIEKPKPHINVQKIIDFGEVKVGKTVKKQLRIENTGKSLLKIKSVSVDNSQFKPAFSCETIEPGKSCFIEISFSPINEGLITGKLLIKSNDPDTGTLIIHLKGKGIKPVVDANPSTIDFGTVPVNEEKTVEIKITNKGKVSYETKNILLTDKINFKARINCPEILETGKSCNITVSFIPGKEGKIEAFINLTNSKKISLKGYGLKLDTEEADIDNDGRVSENDVDKIINIALSGGRKKADLNKDGKTDISDIILLLRVVKGVGK